MTQPPTSLIDKVRQAYNANQIMLPDLPEVAMRIREAIHSEDVNLQNIAKLIQMDPVITARLIQIANSPLHRGNAPIEDCRAAIVRLGLATTQEIVTCLAIQNIFAGVSKPIQKRVRQVWEHSCKVAAYSYVLAQVTPGLNEEKAMLAGLIHDIGVLAVLNYASDFPEFLEHQDRLQEVIQQMRGVLGKAILKKWKFDADLAVVPEHADNWMRQHSGSFDYSDAVILAQRHCFFGEPTEMHIPSLLEIPAFKRHGFYQLGPEASLELIDEAKQEIASIVQLLNTKAA